MRVRICVEIYAVALAWYKLATSHIILACYYLIQFNALACLFVKPQDKKLAELMLTKTKPSWVDACSVDDVPSLFLVKKQRGQLFLLLIYH